MKTFYLPVFWAYVGTGFVGKTSSYLRIRRFIGRKVRRPPEAGEIAGKGVCKRFHARSLTWRSRWTQWLKRSSCYRSARWKRFSLVRAFAFCHRFHTTFRKKLFKCYGWCIDTYNGYWAKLNFILSGTLVCKIQVQYWYYWNKNHVGVLLLKHRLQGYSTPTGSTIRPTFKCNWNKNAIRY